MNNRSLFKKILLPGMLVLLLSFAGCGGSGESKDDAAAGEREQGTEAASQESGGESAATGSSGGSRSGDVYEELAETIEGIESREDVNEADPKIGELYDELYDALKAEMRNPSDPVTSSANSKKMQAMNERIDRHVRKLAIERPDVAAALGASIAKNGMKLVGLMNEGLNQAFSKENAADLQKAMEELKEKMGSGK